MEFLILFQFRSVTQSCTTLCDPSDCSTPGLLVHHQLLEVAQTHVHQVQISHPYMTTEKTVALDGPLLAK